MHRRFASFLIFIAAFWRILLLPVSAQIGGLDASFNPGAILNGASNGAVRAQSVTSSGLYVVAGDFTTVAGATHGRIARLNVDGSLDATFATGAGANGPIHAVALDSSGNILIGGEFTTVDGVARNRIARLTTSGALDTTFNPGTGFNSTVYALTLNGSSIYAGGDFTTYNGATRNRIAALGSTGTVSSSTFGGGMNSAVRALRVDSNNGVLYAGGDFTTAGGTARSYYAQFSLSSDSLSSEIIVFNGPVRAIELFYNYSFPPTRRLLVGGDFTTVGTAVRGRLAAFSLGGSSPTLDLEFNFWLDAPCRAIAVSNNYTSNNVFVAGDFTTINGQSRSRFAAVLFGTISLGSSSSYYWDLNTGYGESGPDASVFSLQLTSDSKPLLGGSFSNFGATPKASYLRLYGDAGSQVPSPPTSPTASALSDTQIYLQWNGSSFASAYALERSNDGSTGWAQIYTGGSTVFTDSGLPAAATRYYRIRASNSNGASAYTATVSATTASAPWTGSGSVSASQPIGTINSTVSAIQRQSDGKILIAGSFTNVLGVVRKYIARLLPDLTLDTSFDPGVGPNGSVTQISLGLNGRIYIYGSFSSVSGSARNSIARLNSNGTLDASFDTTSTWSFSKGIKALPDGRLIVYGGFQTFFGAPRDYIARLNLDGTADRSFNCTLSSQVIAMSLQSDGKMLLAGYFSSVNGTARSYFARIGSEGVLDATFTGTATSGNIAQLASLGSGKLLTSGSFTTLSGVSRKSIARLNADGTVDATFDPGTSTDTSSPLLFPQPDGKVILAGNFISVGGTTRWHLARLNADGTLDATFKVDAGPGDGTINSVLTLPDNSLLVGGTFTTFGAITRAYLVHLKGDTATTAPTAPSSLTSQPISNSSLSLNWGQLPDEYSWKIERSPDGTSQWVQVAEVEWDTTTFTDTGLATGTTYYYRIRATNSAGDSPYSTVATARTLKSYEQWKLNSGYSLTEPENSDSDNDGIGLLLEYALGLDPATAQLDGAPTMQVVGGVLALSYLHLRSDVIYSVETSTDLANWSTAGVNQGTGIFPIAWTPTDGAPQKYLRLRVTIP